MLIYYSQTDIHFIKQSFSPEPAITTSRVARYLMDNDKTLKRKKDLFSDRVAFNLNFFAPVNKTEFVIGGISTYDLRSGEKKVGPTYIERHLINHSEGQNYSFIIDKPIAIQVLKDLSHTCFFAFPISGFAFDDILFSVELNYPL